MIAASSRPKASRRSSSSPTSPSKYPTGGDFAPGATVHHRDAARRGAARPARDPGRHGARLRPDLRRREAPPPQARHCWRIRRGASFINERSARAAAIARVKSNCISVVPLETEFGRKRAIDQSTCNKDYSCLKGFCPSFVTIEGGKLRSRRPRRRRQRSAAGLPEPRAAGARPALQHPRHRRRRHRRRDHRRAARHGRASRGQGRTVLDMTGLAQKGGAVFSHVRIAEQPGRHPRGAHRGRRRRAAARLRHRRGGERRRAREAAKPGRIARRSSTPHETMTGDFTRTIPMREFPTEALPRRSATRPAARQCDFLDASAPRDRAARRFDRQQPVHAGLRLPEGAAPASRPRRSSARSSSTAPRSR